MDLDYFDQLMLPFSGIFETNEVKTLAVACSGGSDSMALTLLLKEWCEAKNISLHALIVDHKLRAESAHEAIIVSERLTRLGVRSHILSDVPQLIESNIQGQAREFRYRLLSQWCEDNKVRYLAVAHHKQDQAETFLMRLGRGSGVGGLGAMRPQENLMFVTLLRPLLGTDKEALVRFLRQNNIDWVEDPSNQKEKFGRVRMRALSDKLEQEGITADRLSKTASMMRKSQEALDWSMRQVLAGDLQVYDVGAFSVSLNALFSMPEVLGLRLLSLLLKASAGQEYPPRLIKVEKLYSALKSAVGTNFSVTSFGAQLRLRGNILWFGREVDKVSPFISLGEKFSEWDGRFDVYHNSDFSNLNLAALGMNGWKQWASEFGKDKADCIYPSFIRQTVPALFSDDKLIAPVASLFGEDEARITEKTKQFGIKFKIPSEFRDFTFSSAASDTM